jgi:hypothetical protein
MVDIDMMDDILNEDLNDIQQQQNTININIERIIKEMKDTVKIVFLLFLSKIFLGRR